MTDADVVLGNKPGNFLGGRIPHDAARAEARSEAIAEPLGALRHRGAWTSKRLIDGYLGRDVPHLRAHLGQDRRDFVLFRARRPGGARPGYATAPMFGAGRHFPVSACSAPSRRSPWTCSDMSARSTHTSTRTATGATPPTMSRAQPEAKPWWRIGERDMPRRGSTRRVTLELEIHMCTRQQRQTCRSRCPG